MNQASRSHQTSLLRKNRVRHKLAQNQELPRLSVHRSLRHIFAQVIDDKTGTTLLSASDVNLKATGTKTEIARQVGATIGTLAKEKSIQAVRFDRGGNKYHGRVAALAQAAREQGLTF